MTGSQIVNSIEISLALYPGNWPSWPATSRPFPARVGRRRCGQLVRRPCYDNSTLPHTKTARDYQLGHFSPPNLNAESTPVHCSGRQNADRNGVPANRQPPIDPAADKDQPESRRFLKPRKIGGDVPSPPNPPSFMKTRPSHTSGHIRP
jgi:hypothetical protein